MTQTAVHPETRRESHGTDATVTPDPEDSAAALASPAARPRRRRSLKYWMKKPGLVLSTVFLALVVTAAFFPHLLATGDPYSGDSSQALRSPGTEFWLGTDHLGRDLYTRVVHGTSLSLRTALIAVVVALISGGVFGLLAGFLGGWVDQTVMRVMDVLLAIPSLLLSLALISALGFGSTNVAVAVALGSVATFARIARSQSLKVCQASYVEAARSLGSRWYTTLRRHVVPNASGPILALAVLEFGMAILAVSALSFLGYGAPRPAPEWGALVSEGRNYMAGAWWLTTLPGLVIACTVLAINRIAHSLGGNRRRF